MEGITNGEIKAFSSEFPEVDNYFKIVRGIN
jgi:hypothetical protein